MWLVWYLLFILPVWRLLDLLPPQYSTYICVRCPDIFLAGTATLPAPIPLPAALGPGCLACNWVLVWMGQIEQAWSGSSPQLQNVYARRVQCWTGVVQPRQNSTDSLFHHFPEHHRHTTFPSTALPEPLPHQTKHVHYYCTSLPERADLG